MNAPSQHVAAAAAPDLAAVRAASQRLAPYCIRTPLLPLTAPPGANRVYLKLENLQPIGSYKVRSVGHVLLAAEPRALEQGVYTASSGNAGVALAWMAQRLGLKARVYASEDSPGAKLDAIRACGAEIIRLDAAAWWQVIEQRGHPADSGLYVDAVRDPDALAGNGTLGLEIAEQLAEVDTVIAPFGGGGVACGTAAALRALKPGTRMLVAESEAATPATAALAAGYPVPVPVKPSFISGVGAPCVLKEMWPLVRDLINGTRVVPVAAVAGAIRHLCRHQRVVAEGAGAIPVAAVLSGPADTLAAFGNTVCLVTGGNIDAAVLAAILRREL